MSDDIVRRLRGIGLRTDFDALTALFMHGTKSRMMPTEFAENLLSLEVRAREARNLARRTHEAALGSVPPLDRFDWNHPRTIDRDLYESLLELDFLRAKQNVLFRGQSGVGKTMLAQNLALRALEKGFTVRFATLGEALADLLKQESLPAVERRLRRYSAPDLLVLDEIGYLPCDARAADLFYNVISRRHEKKATIVTTNLAFKQWSTVFPGAACVVALVDRFAQHCHILDIDADSYRQKSSLKSAKKAANRSR